MGSHRKGSSVYDSKPKEHKCEFCGTVWTGYNKRFCTNECRQKSYLKKIYTDEENTCVICGNLIKQKKGRHAITCSVECRNTLKNKRSKERYKPKERTDALRARERERYKKTHPGSMIKEERSAFLASERERKREEKKEERSCVICGKSFVDWKNGTRKTCSAECSKELKKETTNRHRDKRLNDENTIDKNISLRKLFKRDAGKCYICGCDCSYGDRNDNTCFGRYPTIEHMIPLSHGGMHSWENVRLACWSCNSKKSDTIPNYIFPAPKYIGKPKTEPKRTLQYTKDGVLVGDFFSTKEAERQTGFSAKQLQKCCRGETKSYKGYVWKYA